VSILRPVCGLDNFAEETLRTSFDLAYPKFELIFCVASARDPVIPLLERLISIHRTVRARLLVGDDRISRNPKLNNCFKGWQAAQHEWIVIADSNVLMPPDYLHRLLAAWRHDTGLVCTPPVGVRPTGFWANLECAFLNAYQARVQYFVDTLGGGFAHGKTMLLRRADLERAGGIGALGTEIAEDANATKIVHAAGLRVRLTDLPCDQPLGRRGMKEVLRRQARWARVRRVCYPQYFVLEIFGGTVPPLVAAAYAAQGGEISPVTAMGAFAVVWYGAEIALAKLACWHLTRLYVVYAAVRDLLLPPLWVHAWLASYFIWRGNRMDIATKLPAA
jgi:ceramide glucosyltransferase